MEASAFHTKLKSYEMSLAAGKENEMDDAKLEFAHRYFSWKRVRGGGIKVIPSEEAILAAQKDFGIFVILSNLHASPWDALRRYRRRNDIETSYRVVKSDLDGRKPRVWTMTSVRGKEICRHVALGLPFRAAEHDGAHGSGSLSGEPTMSRSGRLCGSSTKN